MENSENDDKLTLPSVSCLLSVYERLPIVKHQMWK